MGKSVLNLPVIGRYKISKIIPKKKIIFNEQKIEHQRVILFDTYYSNFYLFPPVSENALKNNHTFTPGEKK